MSGITVRPVSGKADTRTFLDVPFAIYRDDPNWVAPLYLERLEHLSPAKNPYFRHAEAQLFLAERDGKAIGRISAQICRLRLEKHKDATGQFGFLEAPDDPAVFAALLSTAEDWLRTRGMKAVQGPFSFSINDECGVLVDGFDRPPNMMMGHARSYYAPHIEAAGYGKAKDLIAYDYDPTKELPRALAATYDKALASSDIALRPLDKKKLNQDLADIIDIFNDAWSLNWGFVPFTSEEIAALARNLKLLVEDEYVWIASYRGQPAAMAVTLPNLNEWIADLNGKLLPFGVFKFLFRVTWVAPTSVRMPLMGVKRAYHGTPIGSALAIAVIESCRRYHVKNGVTQAELSWILEDNLPMRRIIELIGAKPYKTYRIYEKAL
ncbi:MAG: dATP pyrophosphohydrolase [Aestuariivirga sp.]